MTGSSAQKECASIEDRLPELALGTLGGTERAEVLDHLNRCARCRDAAAGWAATVDALPTLLEETEPPAGFEARTLERMRADRARIPRRSLTYRLLGVAAIAAVVMVVTLATVRIIDARSSDSSPNQVASAAMIGDGHHVGNVFITSGSERYVFLDVDYGVKTGKYAIEAVDGSNRVTALGSVAIDDGRGTWAGALGEDASGAPTRVRLVNAEGTVVCSARFGVERADATNQ